LIVAIILARGGSVGLPQKNKKSFCGAPLIKWTIENFKIPEVEKVYVSSDDHEILDIATQCGAETINRPKNLCNDDSSSESGWLHALELIEAAGCKPDWVLGPQVTSPLRFDEDVFKAVEIMKTGKYDSIFSASISEDLGLWAKRENTLTCLNYDWTQRLPRQKNELQYVENGSFYAFRPKLLRQWNNRLSGNIGVVPMKFWQMFEIDDLDDFNLCEILMETFILKKHRKRP
jgi:N-acylneuraminate cytidylyltransferase